VSVLLAQDVDVTTDLGVYLPLVAMFVLALGFAIFSALLGPLVGPSRYNRAKFEAYECGIEPSPQPIVGGGRVPVAYYLTAMLFILFDIEMVFLYPFAVSADALGLFGLVEIFLFIATVGFAYAYVWRRGGLDWN
jgi:NADH-quinone oxidoreductase subunit A